MVSKMILVTVITAIVVNVSLAAQPRPGGWKVTGTGKAADGDDAIIYFGFSVSDDQLSLITDGPIKVQKGTGDSVSMISFVPPDPTFGSLKVTIAISDSSISFRVPRSDTNLEGTFDSETTAQGTWQHTFPVGPFFDKLVPAKGTWTASYIGVGGVKELIENLKILNAKVREEAAETLGCIKHNRAVEPLIALLEDEDEDIGVREAAAKALGKIKDERAIEPLTAALKDEDVDARWRAAERLRNELTGPKYPVRRMSSGETLSCPVILENPEDLSVPEGTLEVYVDYSKCVVYTNHIICSKVHIEGNLNFFEDDISYTMDTTKDKYGNYVYIYAFKEDEEGRMICTININVPNPHNLSEVTFDFSDPGKNYVVERKRSIRKAAAWTLAEMKHDKRVGEALAAGLKDQDLIVVAGAYKFFLEESTPDVEDALVRALKEYGDKNMAEDFLNSGNSKLEAAARDYLSSR